MCMQECSDLGTCLATNATMKLQRRNVLARVGVDVSMTQGFASSCPIVSSLGTL